MDLVLPLPVRLQTLCARPGKSGESEGIDLFDFETQTVLLVVVPRRKTEWLVIRMDEAEVIHLRQAFGRGCGFVWGFDAGTALPVCGLIGV